MSQLRSGPVAPGVAFITGGARGLGNAIAQSFAKEGARGIALIDINDDKTFEEGRKAVEQYGTKVSLWLYTTQYFYRLTIKIVPYHTGRCNKRRRYPASH